MANEESRDVVQQMIERGMIDGDAGAAAGFYAPEFIYHNPMLADSRGEPDVVRQLIDATWAAFPDLNYSIDVIIADGDLVSVLYTWTGTHQGSLGGMPATGRKVTATGAIFCRIAGGRIVEQWDIDDRLSVMQQLGLFPPPAQPPAQVQGQSHEGGVSK